MLDLCRYHPRLLSKIPVIFCAHDSSLTFERSMAAIRAGAHDVVLTPFDGDKLARVTQTLHALATSQAPEKTRRSADAIRNDEPRRNGVSRSTDVLPAERVVTASLRSPLPRRTDLRNAIAVLEESIHGVSPAISNIRATIAEVACTKASVLIQGESGTGKELVAAAIHQISNRRTEKFVPVNLSAIPPGLAESTLFGHEKGAFTSAVATQIGWCEAAHRGTLFLDEVGEMELSLQPKLLRFLQESTIQRVGSHEPRPVDVRVIAATNRDLREMVAERRMREDLYFRLHVVPIVLPSLRDRSEDIAPLALLFLRRHAGQYGRPITGISPAALDLLNQYSWPGNIRQLENVIERTVIFAKGRSIEPEDLPSEVHGEAIFRAPSPHHRTHGRSTQEERWSSAGTPTTTHASHRPDLRPIQRHERVAIVEALHRSNGHVIDAARLLGLGQATVYRKIREYQIPHTHHRRRVPK
jgi:DNA-binding NtrC family response regulator